MSDLSGRKFGKYQLRERLGRGGMADVYKAYQPGMDRFVAVKLLHGHLADSENFIERFKREAQSVGQLRHPNILQVIDFDADGDVYYMVMEYIKGDTLKSYIQEKGALPADEALRIAEQLADALDYAHSHKMIHRDIKPANVMFTDMSRSHPVLTDFGIARIISDSGLTASGAFVGTPAYMPPEAGRSEPVDERSDIYSLGIMIYEMLTGKVPYDADTPFAVVMKHVNEPLPSIRKFNAQLPESVERILLKALSKDPADRFQTAADFKNALKKARESLPAEQPTADSDAFSTNVESLTPTTTKVGSKHPLDTAATVIETAPPPDDKTVIKNIPAAASRKFAVVKYGGAVAAVAIIFVIGLFVLGNDNDGDNTSSPNNEQAAVTVTQTDSTSSDGQQAVANPTQTEDSTSPQLTEPAVMPTQQELGSGTTSATQVAESSDTNTDDSSDESPVQDFLDQAYQHFDDGNYEAAVEAFSGALELDPDNIDAYAGRADSYLALENYEAGIDDYTQVLDRDPTNADALGNRSDSYMYLGNADAALDDINAAIESDSDNPDFYITRGWVNIELEDFEAAIGDFSQAIEFAPDSSDAYFGRGVMYHIQGQFDPAIADLTQAIELGTTDSATLADVHSERGEVYQETGEIDLALSDVNSAIEINPEEAYYFESRAVLQLEQGNTEAAIADLERAVGLEPLNADFHRELGDLYFDQERPRDALSQYQVYLVLEGDRADVDIVARVQRLSGGDDGPTQIEDRPRFTSYVADDNPNIIARANEIDSVQYLDNTESAIDAATQALEDYPGNPILLTLRSDLYLNINLYDEALGDAEAAQAANPDHPAGYIALSRYYFRVPESDYDRAFEYAETAFGLASEQQEVVLHYANALQLLGHADEAIDMYNRAEELGAPLRPLLNLRGNLNFQIGRYEDAASDFTRYLTFSDDLGVRYSLMGAYLLSDQSDQALFTAIDGLGQNNDANYFANIAYVAYRIGDDEQATQWANDALIRDGNQFAAYYALALVSTRNGDFDTAIEYFDLLNEQETWQYDWPFLNEQYGQNLVLDRARLARAMGDAEQTEAFYAQVIEETYWYLPPLERGRMYFEQGRINEAFDDYFRAFYVSDGNEQLTQQILDEFLAYGPDIVGRAIFRFLNDDVEGTAQLATRALEMYPTDPTILVGRANAYLMMGDPESALADVQAAIDANPDAPIAYAGLVDYYRFTEQTDEMLAAAERAREIGPDDPSVLLSYARALRTTDSGSPVLVMYQAALDAGADAETVLQERAEYAFDLGEFQQARESIQQLVEINPDIDTVTGLIGLNIILGDYADAFTVALQYTDLAVDESQQAQYFSTLAYAAYRADENGQARDWLSAAFELDDNLATGIYLDGLLLARQGQFEAAIERLQELESREAWEYEQGFFNERFGHTLNIDLARIYRAMGNVDMARERYQDLPFNARLFVERAEFYIEIGEPELARQDLLAAQQINTDTFNEEALNTRIDELLRSLGRAPTTAPE